MVWGHATPVLTEVLAMAWDVTREAHGAELGAVRINQQSLWNTEREYWSKPGGKGVKNKLSNPTKEQDGWD